VPNWPILAWKSRKSIQTLFWFFVNGDTGEEYVEKAPLAACVFWQISGGIIEINHRGKLKSWYFLIFLFFCLGLVQISPECQHKWSLMISVAPEWLLMIPDCPKYDPWLTGVRASKKTLRAPASWLVNNWLINSEWMSMDIHGYPWISMDILGHSNSMEFRGYPESPPSPNGTPLTLRWFQPDESLWFCRIEKHAGWNPLNSNSMTAFWHICQNPKITFFVWISWENRKQYSQKRQGVYMDRFPSIHGNSRMGGNQTPYLHVLGISWNALASRIPQNRPCRSLMALKTRLGIWSLES